MAHPRRIIGSFKENQIAWFCFCFGNMPAFLPKSIGGGTPHVITVLIVDPADVTGTVKASFGRTAAPDIRCADVFLGFLIDGRKFTVGQSFRRNRVVDAGCAGAIRAAGLMTQTVLYRICTSTHVVSLYCFLKISFSLPCTSDRV